MTASSLAPPDGPVALACGADANYALPLAVTLSSALSGLPRGRRLPD